MMARALILFLILSSPLKAKEIFFENHAEGWHWYQDNYKEINDENDEQALTPSEKIQEQRKNLKQKLHGAILDPTPEKITAYLLAQKAIMDQSQRFAQSWKRVLFTSPQLDETLTHPTDQNALHVYYDQKEQDKKQRIKALAREYGLFFFFRGSCPYCHQFAPIVKSFAQEYGWKVLAISIDGSQLPEFPNAKQDNGVRARLNISHIPALIAIHPATEKIIPLGYGMVSQSEIEDRVELLTKVITEPMKRSK